jgi:hypothetical protein
MAAVTHQSNAKSGQREMPNAYSPQQRGRLRSERAFIPDHVSTEGVAFVCSQKKSSELDSGPCFVEEDKGAPIIGIPPALVAVGEGRFALLRV